MKVCDQDASFAILSMSCQMDAIDRLQDRSPEFYFWLMETGNDCAQLMGPIDSWEYRRELQNYLGAMNYFLLGIWSANSGQLPLIPVSDYNIRLESMGRSDYLMHELYRWFSHRESFHFEMELDRRLGTMHLFTKCHAMLAMCIVMEALGEEAVH